jgi:flagellar hook-basal body complex protein FliE
MSVDAIGFLAPMKEISLEPHAQGTPGADFSSWLARQLSETNAQVVKSDRLLQGLAARNMDNLHQVMIALEDAKLSMQLAVQVRNKVLEAYQELLRMSV